MIRIKIGDTTKRAMKELGIESYPFTVGSLKRSYRAAVKEYHPDTNQNDGERMKAINAAFAILKNLALTDEEQDVEEALAEQANLQENDIFAVYEPCRHCNGTGEYEYYDYVDSVTYCECPKCRRTGDYHVTCRACKGSGKFTLRNGKEVDCKNCKGTGYYNTGKRCYTCDGCGTIATQKRVLQKRQCDVCAGTGKTKMDLFNPVIPKGAVL